MYDDDEEDIDEVPPLSPVLLEGPTPAIYPITFPVEDVDPDAAKVVYRLTRYGHQAYLVGGCVRDLLLGRRPKDFDVATSARPSEVRRLFRNCRVIGRRFRLAHILFAGGKIIEVATFRRDPGQTHRVTPYAQRPPTARADTPDPVRLTPIFEAVDDDSDLLIRNDNVFGMPHEDAVRRDFTINGLFYDVQRGEVIDYVGGMQDIADRTVRTIGEPDVRLREDPVRILRAIKFSARLDLGVAPDLYDAMVDFRDELTRAARPRLLEELFRLMRGGAAQRSIYLAWDLGVLAELLPEVTSFLDDDAPGAAELWGRLQAIDRLKRAERLPDDAVLLAALLLGPIEEALDGAREPGAVYEEFMEDLALRLTLPRRIKDRIRLLVGSQRRLRAGKVGSLARRDFFADAAALHALDLEARGLPIPDWAVSPGATAAADDDELRPRRRRRRRRRGGG
ncbi:MAG: CCA tRNA nucleotidyltransferase [Myxococcales bacterium]|nr:CCA tRNA nucleotidyltransferase [Myxococcales bacterium]